MFEPAPAIERIRPAIGERRYWAELGLEPGLEPALFGLVREFAPPATEIAAAGAAPWVFAMAALIQGLAIAAFLFGRKR